MKSKNKYKPVLLQIAQLGNPVVRKKAKPVGNYKDGETKQLIFDMIATCQDADGVGISASQVYKNLRLFIIASHPNKRYPYAPKMRPLPIINPKILSTSQEKTEDWEGCLSIPGIRGLVPRYNVVVVEYLTKEGKIVKRRLAGFVARIWQHEFDHLEGKVFLDRIETTRNLITEKEYQKRIRTKVD